MHVDADATMVVKTRSELWQIIQNSETVTNLVIGMMHMHTNSNESLIMFRYPSVRLHVNQYRTVAVS